MFCRSAVNRRLTKLYASRHLQHEAYNYHITACEKVARTHGWATRCVLVMRSELTALST